jgi:hypothetical protein
MGAGAGGYVQITLQTLKSDFFPATPAILGPLPTPGSPPLLHRISRLSFAGAQIPGKERDHPLKLPDPLAAPTPGSPPAGKVGLGLDARHVKFRLFAELQDTTLADMGATPDAAITTELQTAFGGTWAGYTVALAPAGGRFRLVAELSITSPFDGGTAVKPFKVIPVVMAFGTDEFAKHYLLSVVVAQPTDEKVDTVLIQPYA